MLFRSLGLEESYMKRSGCCEYKFQLDISSKAYCAAQLAGAPNQMSGNFLSQRRPYTVILGARNPKEAAEDTSLTVDNTDGGKTNFPVPSGTEIVLHVPALHNNCM